ncbi:MAG: UvrD-helicase domain-containing protein, partial [Spirochaetaceae bacterium]|nr:UvrD-helicase domain-containing protein [Spirochaetaceae bacterium]
MKLDEEQKAAYQADQNAVVSAGAGSGKTTVLAERYVRLVTERGLAVNEVLTLTFTRKAAAEMYERIFNRLSASRDPAAQEKLAQFDQARIATLDSFCTAIVRGASYRYGISGDFRLDEAELKEAAEETAVDMVMRRRHVQAVRRLVSVRGFEEVAEGLFAHIAQHVFSLAAPCSYRELGKKQTAFLAREAEARAKDLAALCETIAGMDAGDNPAGKAAKVKAAVKQFAPVLSAPLACPRKTLYEAAAFFAGSKSFDLRFGNTKDPSALEIKEKAWDLKKKLAPKLLDAAKSLLFEEDIQEIGEFLDEYQGLFLERKRARGLLSFRDAAELAVDILLTDIDLRNYYKRHIKAVMIDEFQDNNETQKNLLYLLAERNDAGRAGALPRAQDLCPDKLFFVGDEKQSIYRFRGADVSVFRGLSQELEEKGEKGDKGEKGSTALTLSANYRSAPLLAAFFNALFPGVFGSAGDPMEKRENFEAAFSPMRTALDTGGREEIKKTEEAPVEVFLQEMRKEGKEGKEGEERGGEGGEDGDEADETEGQGTGQALKEIGEALAIAARIRSGVGRKEFGFGDVAVLFRNTTSQSGYERVFRDAGIPFSAVDPRGLFLEAPAHDFYAILRLSLFPLDRNAYAAVLRSPFAG